MREHGSLPRAREEGLLEETAGEELLLYDQDSHIAHCLSPIAARVWRLCDGELDVTELAQLAGASESLVADALRELREKNLLDAEPQLTQSTLPGISRREAISRGVRYGAAATAVPLIISATAATPAMANSVAEGGCPKNACKPAEGSKCCCCEKANITIGETQNCNQQCEDKGEGPALGAGINGMMA